MIALDLFLFLILGIAIIFLATFLGMKLLGFILFKRLEADSRSKSQTLMTMARSLKKSWMLLTLIIASYFAFKIIPLNADSQEVVGRVFFTIFIIYFAWLIHRLITCKTESLIADRKEQRRSITLLKFFNRLFDILIWVIVGLLVIFMMGYDITVLLAGLGVSGVLIAIASQRIFSDLFYSLALHSDHVFEEGDFIVIGDSRGSPGGASGRIERIGLRSTHLRSPTGESIIVSNGELTSKVIYNYSKKKEARMSLNFGVSYEVDSKKLRQLDEIVKEVLARQNLVKRGQLVFREFASQGPTFELVYDLETSDYDEMRLIHGQIGLTLKEKLEEADIKMVGD